MWIAIGIIGAFTLANSFCVWLLIRRLSEAEYFLLVILGAVLNDEQQKLVRQFIKTRADHPAGKTIEGETVE